MKNINKAVEHFVWKLKNTWKATDKDIDAINEIIDFIEQKHREQFNKQQLFAKLYITFYGELLRFYRCSVLDPQPQKSINKILSMPIEQLIEIFVNKANDEEVFLRMRENGIKEIHPLLLSDEEKKEEYSKFKKEMLEDLLTTEEATENLTALINFAINKYY